LLFETHLKENPMTQTCETVRIASPVTEENKNGYVVINASDLTSIDTLFVDAPEADQFDSMTRDELKAYLVAASVDFAGNTGDAKLRVLCREIVK
jgi:hypothetical protein